MVAQRPVQWRNSLSFHLQYQYPTWTHVPIPTLPFLTQLPVNALGKQWRMAEVHRLLIPGFEISPSPVVTIIWGNEPENGRPLSVSPSISNSASQTKVKQNKKI